MRHKEIKTLDQLVCQFPIWTRRQGMSPNLSPFFQTTKHSSRILEPNLVGRHAMNRHASPTCWGIMLYELTKESCGKGYTDWQPLAAHCMGDPSATRQVRCSSGTDCHGGGARQQGRAQTSFLKQK